MSKNRRLKALDKIRLIRSWLDYAMEQTESWEVKNLGSDLAYLCHAIVNNEKCEWAEDRPLVQLILQRDPKRKAAVWRFIVTVNDREQ